MKMIKEIPRPDTNKYSSWGKNLRWGLYQCPICGKAFNAPVYGIEKGLISSCGCTIIHNGTNNLNKYREINKKHPHGKYITYNDKTLNLTEWSRLTNIPRSTISNRLKKGLPMEEVFKEYEENNKSN